MCILEFFFDLCISVVSWIVSPQIPMLMSLPPVPHHTPIPVSFPLNESKFSKERKIFFVHFTGRQSLRPNFIYVLIPKWLLENVPRTAQISV